MAASGRSGADERLAAELAAGKKVATAAKAAEVSERTAYRRLDDQTFRARIAELRGRMVAEASGQLTSTMSAAAQVLRSLLVSKDENVKRHAAVKIIELGIKVGELHDLQQRVEELERRAGRRKT